MNNYAVFFLNNTVNSFNPRVAKKEGFLFGVELELEGRGVALEGLRVPGWVRMEEGSLRGEHTEFVFSQPKDFEASQKSVKSLFNLLTKAEAKINRSFRTSTHVHLNFADKTNKQVISFFFIYTILERLLEEFCGEGRGGNLFCLSCRDTEMLITMLTESVFDFGDWNRFDNDVRYNACNLASLNKFGTIEIRTMRGAESAEQVNEWLDILNQLYVFACSEDCPPPWKLCENLSHLGSQLFLKQFFNEETVQKLLAAWPPIKDLSRSFMEGVRLIQLLAYRLQEEWETPFEAKPVIEPKIELDKLVIRKIHDRIQLRNGVFWYVERKDKVLANIAQFGETAYGADILHYDLLSDIWRHRDTGEPCLWVIKDGFPVNEQDLCNIPWFEYHGDDHVDDEGDEY